MARKRGRKKYRERLKTASSALWKCASHSGKTRDVTGEVVSNKSDKSTGHLK